MAFSSWLYSPSWHFRVWPEAKVKPKANLGSGPTADIEPLFSERGDKLALPLKPLRLLQTDELHTQLDAFIANSTGGLLTFCAHGYRVD
jgi:hypothetical protein